MKQKQTKAEKDAENRILEAYRCNCSGISIPIMRITDVFKAGREAIAAGADDGELGRTLRTVALALSATI